MTEKELLIGNYNDLEVAGRDRGQYILSSVQGNIPLTCDTRGADIRIGDVLEVFIYTGKDGSLAATLSTPYAVVGEVACMTVIDSGQSGAYLDWGIERDLFVFHKDQKRPMKVGKRYVVYVRWDKVKRRIQATSFLDVFLKRKVSVLKEKEQVSLLIYDITEIGIMAVVNGLYSGMIYINECFEKVKIGDVKQGYIKKIRDDGGIDLTLQPFIVDAISNSKKIVLDALKKSGGLLPFHDKSDPEEIKKTFSMSKKNFKRAIGGLYREKKIHIGDNGISLVEKAK